MSRKLGVRGVIDEVLHLDDDTFAPLDYKFAEYSDHTFETQRVQSVLYALMIMENYRKDVRKGFICYVRSSNKVKEIVYDERDFVRASDVIAAIFRIIITGYYPDGTGWRNRCLDCCYRNICVT